MAGKITALRVQSRNKQRVNVYLDGAFAFGLAKIEAARLKVGQALSNDDIARLKALDEIETHYERALKFLSYRPRAEAEIRRHLGKHKAAEPVIEAVIERLKRAGLADDEAFARFWIENRAQFRPKSQRALRAELRRKGLTSEQADEALAATQADDAEAAYQAAAARARRLYALPRREFRRKLGEFLARRGFDYQMIEETVERIWGEAVRNGWIRDSESESED